MAPETQSAPAALSRQARKQATRGRLLSAAMDIILEDGVGGLTTGRISAGAGIAQSGFYVHFENIDACLSALGDEVAGTLVDLEADLRRQRLPRLAPEQMLQDAIERMGIVLNHCLQSPRELELLLRCRLDPGPLGEGVRRAIRRGERLVVQDLWDVAVGLGLRGAYLPEVELIGAILRGTFLGALELCVLDGDPDVNAIANALGTSQYHYAGAELWRLCVDQAQQDQARSC